MSDRLSRRGRSNLGSPQMDSAALPTPQPPDVDFSESGATDRRPAAPMSAPLQELRRRAQSAGDKATTHDNAMSRQGSVRDQGTSEPYPGAPLAEPAHVSGPVPTRQGSAAGAGRSISLPGAKPAGSSTPAVPSRTGIPAQRTSERSLSTDAPSLQELQLTEHRPEPESLPGAEITREADQNDGLSIDLREALEWAVVADSTAQDTEQFLDTLTEVASGADTESSLPIMLLAISQILMTGARLGAMQDIVPSDQFEPDSGPEINLEPLRDGLANLLDGIDVYADVVDPITQASLVSSQISDDLVEVAADLAHGLGHYRHGRIDEALWWWQFSYLSTWGARATSSLRAVQSILHHLRLDADPDVMAEAQFEALHSGSSY